jgi:ribulose-phosphate 3-epimerase
VLDQIDLVLLMSVNPGFGGQQFIPHTLQKLQQTRLLLDRYAEYSKRKILLEVDGGVKVENIAEIAMAGADVFVFGSAIFGQPDYAKVVRDMRTALRPFV